MKTLWIFSLGLILAPISAACAQETVAPGNPLFAVPSGDPFGGEFYAAPGSSASPSVAEQTLQGGFQPEMNERFWASADFFHAVGQGTRVPALITGANPGTPLGSAGALFDPNSRVLFGGQRELIEFRPGIRGTVGFWLGQDRRLGLDANILYLGDQRERFLGTTNPTGFILAQPIINGANNTSLGIPVGLTAAETIRGELFTSAISGDANLRWGITSSEIGRTDFLLGYRYAQLRDTVRVESERTPLAGLNLPGLPASLQNATVIRDQFRTRNDFHGPQLGVATTHRLFDRLTLSTQVKVGLGVTISETTLEGQAFSPLGVANSGLLIQDTNRGSNTEEYFSVMPESVVRLGFDATERIRMNVGYSILYWSKVRRAADQIDLTVASPGRPAFPSHTTDYWIQGWSIGFEARY